MGKLELILSSRAATCISTKHSESAGQENIGKGVPHMPQHLVTSGLWLGLVPLPIRARVCDTALCTASIPPRTQERAVVPVAEPAHDAFMTDFKLGEL